MSFDSEDFDNSICDELADNFPEEIFQEDFGEDSDEEMDDTEDCEGDKDDGSEQLSISAKMSRENYKNAGRLMPEEPEKISIEDFQDHMNVKAAEALNMLEEELDLPYTPLPYQRIAISCAVSGENVVLVVPCGSGKSDVFLKGARVLRMTSGDPFGVTLVTQPITALQMEKMKNPIAGVCVLSMAGELTVMDDSGEGTNGVLSCPVEDLVAGKYPVLIGHRAVPCSQNLGDLPNSEFFRK